jgi:uncharacterized protein GlcG (DUF336 family)
MRGFQYLAAVAGIVSAFSSASFAQSPAAPPQLISRAEVRVIIDGAMAYATEKGTLMGVAVVDTAGDMIGAERMDGAGSRNVRFAEAKAFAAAAYRQPTQQLADLYKTRPDRYFGIMNMYGNKVYLVGGGVPLALDGKLVGAVGVAGLPEGEDEKAGRAGIAAWMRFRETMKK